ncbi:MAG TPA: ATP-binding cassette domain-containing protein, partial [Abditibacterium sp.]
MLELRAVSKHFGAFTALDGVDFGVKEGEIVALLGENGAGKSTAIGIIGGEIAPDGGEILWNGAPAQWKNPREAAQNGIGVVHQHFSLIPALSVAENLSLSCGQGAIFRPADWEQRAMEWAQSLGWKLDPRAKVGDLSVGEQQRIEILKALFGGEKTQLLLLDEPTANLTPRESDELFETLRELKSRGLGIVFVSHKLREVLDLCDRATVLRRGKVAGEREISQTDVADLTQLMVGRAIDESEIPSSLKARGEVLLELENVAANRLCDISFEVHAGEIVALAGVDGNGQRELFEVLAGLCDY